MQETDEPTNGVAGERTSPAPPTLRRRPSHRRQSSVAAISWSRFDQNTGGAANPSSRRDSNASWMRDGELDYDMSTRTGRSGRPFSWGPVGEFYYRESLCLSETDRSLFSHHECTLCGCRP